MRSGAVTPELEGLNTLGRLCLQARKSYPTIILVAHLLKFMPEVRFMPGFDTKVDDYIRASSEPEAVNIQAPQLVVSAMLSNT